MSERAALIAALGPVLRRVEFDPWTDCWLWIGGLTAQGYPTVTLDGRKVYLHRLMLLARGLNLRGKIVHHRCETRRCIAPYHLRAMSRRAHVRLHARQRGRPVQLRLG
jgi:hypothetical protein